MMVDNSDCVWIFHGAAGRVSAGVFRDRALAVAWIEKHALTSTLTRYPLDVGVYDWAVSEGLFLPKKEEHRTPEFIGGFTTASQEHYHFEDGVTG